MNPKIKWLLIGMIILLALIIIFRKPILRLARKLYRHEASLPKDNLCPNCDRYFTDLYNTHKLAYRAERIEPQRNFDGLKKLHEQGILESIESNDDYELDENMNSSMPYLLPKGIQFLKKLALSYRAACAEKGLTYAPFRITSLTRCSESVNELVKVNSNALKNSHHLYGKTMDVGYITPEKYSAQKTCFIKTLNQLRDQGLCYVVYETQYKCLHITAR